MSARFSVIPARAIDDARLSRGALLVLCALGAYGDKNGWCWPSQGEVARRIRLHRTNVGRHIAELEKLGYLEKRRQTQEGKGEVNSLYRVLFDGELPAEFDTELQCADTEKCTPPVRSDRTPPVRSDRTRTSHRTSHRTPQGNAPNKRSAPVHDRTPAQTPIANPSNSPAEFEAFWREYPKRNGGNSKHKALSAWNARRQEGHAPEEMQAGVHRYAAWCQATGKIGTEFVKQASTFLGAEKGFLEPWDLPPPDRPCHSPPATPLYRHPDADAFDTLLQNLNHPVIEGEVIHELH